jgi:hypothetical protein
MARPVASVLRLSPSDFLQDLCAYAVSRDQAAPPWLRFENLATLSSAAFVLEIRLGPIPANTLRSHPATCRIGFVFARNGFVPRWSPHARRPRPRIRDDRARRRRVTTDAKSVVRTECMYSNLGREPDLKTR